MRKICFSSAYRVNSVFSFRAVRRSWPNGFSTMMRCSESPASLLCNRPVWCSCSTTWLNRLGDVPLAIGNIGGELRPDRVLDRLGPGKLLKRGAQFLSPGVVSFFPTGKTDDAKRRGQLFLAVEM